MPHEVNVPNAKKFNLKDEIKGHLILPRWIPYPLTSITGKDIIMDIVKNRMPKEIHLKYLAAVLEVLACRPHKES